MSKKVLIIGAGTAGLASGIRLKALGYDVEIYEKEPQVGGRMYQLEQNGFKFDVGPTIVMMPEIYKDVFKAAGRNPNDYISIKKLDTMFTLNYKDGYKIKATNDLTDLIKDLEAISPEDTLGYLKYLADVYERYLVAINGLIRVSYRKKRDFYNLKSLRQLVKLKTLNSAYSSLSKFIKDERLRQSLAFQTLYIGISPFAGPSIYTIIPMIELIYGVWYIKGGMYAMAKAMERLFVELGGIIHLNSPVKEIVIQDKIAKGIIVKDNLIEADAILCNADFPYAMNNLVLNKKAKGKYTKKKIDNMEYSSSSFMLYIGTKKKYSSLSVHNIFFANDFVKNIEDLFTDVIPSDPSFYIYSPTQIDPSLANEGKEVLYVLVPTPNLQNQKDVWTKERIVSYQQSILSLIEKIPGLEDIKENIEVLMPFTPNDFKEKFNLYNGATFGLKPTLFQSSYFRPQPKFPYVKNLYFTGSSNHPGAGVPIVLTSAELAVNEIKKDLKP